MTVVHRTYRYAADLRRSQHKWLHRLFCNAADLYDRLLEESKTAYREWKEAGSNPKTKPSPNRNNLFTRLTKLRQEDKEKALEERFWCNVSVNVIRGIATRLASAYSNFFDNLDNPARKVGYPRPKKGRIRSLTIVDPHEGMVKLDPPDAPRRGGNSAYLAIKGVPKIRFRPDDRLKSALRNDPKCVQEIRIVKNARRTEVQLVVALKPDIVVGQHLPTCPVGLDMGVKSRVVTSDNEVLEPNQRDHKERRRIQRKMARSAPTCSKNKSIPNKNNHKPKKKNKNNTKSSNNKPVATKVRKLKKSDYQSKSTHNKNNGTKFRTLTSNETSNSSSKTTNSSNNNKSTKPNKTANNNKYSNTYRKRRRQQSKLLARESEQQRHATHRFTSDLVSRYDGIAAEDLQIKNMTRKGRNKKGLNRAILEQAWGQIRRQLEYKAENADCWFVSVNPAYTSRDCSQCGNRKGQLPLSVRTYRCRVCGHVMDRDLNAAINVCDRALNGEWAVLGGNIPGATRTIPNNGITSPSGGTGQKSSSRSVCGGVTQVASSNQETATLALSPPQAASSSPVVAVQYP